MSEPLPPPADAPIEAVDRVTRRRAVRAALGHEPFDLLLVGGTVVDVGVGRLRPADVGIVGPLIASVHETGARTDALETMDCTGRFIAPGLVDMHVHFESSMLDPTGYASVICPRGTTTVYCDPHELANVSGVDGVRYAIDATRGLPVRFITQAPSCVPPVPTFELGGADLHGKDIEEMLSWPDIAALAEVMDFHGVLTGDPRMDDVMDAGLASGKLINGHATGLTGQPLQGYLTSGVQSDHNIFSHADLVERVEAGMTVELVGFSTDTHPELVAALQSLGHIPTHVVAATDDLFAMTLVDEGGVDRLLRSLIRCGLDPIEALRLATYNAAYRLRRADLGLVAPGRRADIIVMTDLPTLEVTDVFTSGVHVAHDGAMIIEVVRPPADAPRDTMHLDPVTPHTFMLRVDAPDGPTRLRAINGSLMTEWTIVTTDVVDGVVSIPPDHILQVAIHRHGRAPAVPVAALLSGRGDWTGAVATTVAHDTHNLVVFGRDAVDMCAAANAVIAAGGGVAVASDGEVIAMIALPIAGIITDEDADVAVAQQRLVQDAASSIGLRSTAFAEPLFELMVASLACIPGPHVTDDGIVDGTTGERFVGLLV